MNTPIDRIKSDFKDFKERVANYVTHKNDSHTCKNLCVIAYEGLYKFKQRIDKELRNRDKTKLTKSQTNQLKKMFDDSFLEGLLKVRNIATHITSNKNKDSNGIMIFSPKNEQIVIECETSAGALFASNIFSTNRSYSGTNILDHASSLNEAVKRLEKKVENLT